MEASDKIRVHWILRASDAEGERLALEQAGESLDEPPRPYEPSDEDRDKYAHALFEPLTILVGTFAVAFLAQQLSAHQRPKTQRIGCRPPCDACENLGRAGA
jgi:hypothetical protein